MASEHDRSSFTEPLPARPNLEMQQKRAKELLRAAWAGVRGRARARPRAASETAGGRDAHAGRRAARHRPRVRLRELGGDEAQDRLADQIAGRAVQTALHDGDVEQVRELIEQHAEVRAVVNAPIGYFDSRPVRAARRRTCRFSTCCCPTARISNLKSAGGPAGSDCSSTTARPKRRRRSSSAARSSMSSPPHTSGCSDRVRGARRSRSVARPCPRRRRQDRASLRATVEIARVSHRPRRRYRRARRRPRVDGRTVSSCATRRT